MADADQSANGAQPLQLTGDLPTHVAIIMDGNGRWAKSRGLPRFRGHSAGMQSVRKVVEAAVEIGIPYLTLYAFSQENWQRPAPEVAALMRLLQHYVRKERDELIRQGVAVRVFGNLERLSSGARKAVDHIEERTAAGKHMQLNLMISYGSREEIVRATRNIAEKVKAGKLEAAAIDESLFSSELYTAGIPDPDLLIRTSGELRISNFMLWQLAYTELYITPTLWPDFRREHLAAAIGEYQKRERRFGRVSTV